MRAAASRVMGSFQQNVPAIDFSAMALPSLEIGHSMRSRFNAIRAMKPEARARTNAVAVMPLSLVQDFRILANGGEPTLDSGVALP